MAAYNGTFTYIHRPVDDTVELDACVIGGRWKNNEYHLPIPRHFENLSIVHLKVVNILAEIKVFGPFCANSVGSWSNVTTNGDTKDPSLGTCAKNIWFRTSIFDVCFFLSSHYGQVQCGGRSDFSLK